MTVITVTFRNFSNASEVILKKHDTESGRINLAHDRKSWKAAANLVKILQSRSNEYKSLTSLESISFSIMTVQILMIIWNSSDVWSY
jgi:hypothetical protein